MGFLEFKGIKKRYKKRDILSGVSFEIGENEIFGLVGSSGCGKSTLLKIIMGMTSADSGSILFEGKDASKAVNYLRKKTGFATQDNMLFDELTVLENSLYFGNLYGLTDKEIKERFNELIALLRLEEFRNTQIIQLSGGMVKRANLLVSLIHKPKLLILDEPTVGLDSVLRDSLWEYIHKIKKTGTTILVTSHLLDEIENNCDRVAILKGGKIAAIGSVEDYFKKYKSKSFNSIFQAIIKNENI